MRRKGFVLNLAGALALVFTFGLPGASVSQAAAFTITSSSFSDGGMIPTKHAAKGGPRKCDGENVSPALQWSNAPAGTKSFAIVVTDAVGGHGLGIVHWVAYGIPASTTSFAEGAVSMPSKDYVGGMNVIKKGFYFGPCPDVGDNPHHYEFTIIALDLAPDALAPGLDLAGLLKAIKGHNLTATSIVGRYARE